MKDATASAVCVAAGVASFPLAQVNALLGTASAAVGLAIGLATLYRMLRAKK
jgi:hypothetical protein